MKNKWNKSPYLSFGRFDSMQSENCRKRNWLVGQLDRNTSSFIQLRTRNDTGQGRKSLLHRHGHSAIWKLATSAGRTAHSERKKHRKRTDNFILRYAGHPVFTTRHSHPPERGRLSDKICTPAGISTFSRNRQDFYGIHLVGRITKRHPDFWDRTKVLSSTDSQATQAGFLVFATDSSKVEVFLPDTKVILDRRVRPDGIAVWNVEDDDTYQVQACADSWIVSRRGRLLYSTYGTDKK